MRTSIKAIRSGIKAGVAAVKHPSLHFTAAGKRIRCPHCGNDTFGRVGIGGLGVAGHGIACSKCSHIEYFLDSPAAED